MPWQFYGFMEPWNPSAYGPLPCKRWIPDGKRHKLNYKWHYSQRGGLDNESYVKRCAIAYAEWLAARDGLQVPMGNSVKPRVDYGLCVNVKGKYASRPRAVEWGTEDGRRGAWSYTERRFEVLLRVEIPHWDWSPAEPVEETIREEIAA